MEETSSQKLLFTARALAEVLQRRFFAAASSAKNGNAIVNTKEGIDRKSVAGDIIINGGYIRSYASGHGNAFGQACCGSNNGKTITVTGGTLLPWSNGSYYDIGGAGGYVVITGGSIKLTGAKAGQAYTGNKFQSGEGNKAFNAPPGRPRSSTDIHVLRRPFQIRQNRNRARG